MVEFINPDRRIFRAGGIDDQQLPTDVYRDSAQYRDVGRFTTRLKFGLHEGNDIVVPVPFQTAHSLQELVEQEAIFQIDPDHEWEKLDRLSDKSKKQRFLQATGHTEATFLALNPARKQRLIWTHLFSPAKKATRMFDIAPSTKNRPDITATISLEGPLAQYKGHTALETRHTFSHNSRFNGKAYKDAQGNTITISSAIAASQDRYTSRAKMLRRVSAKRKSLIYTSPPESFEKAKEQAQFMFLQELATPERLRKGLKKRANGEYEFTYVVDSLLSPGKLLSAKEANKNRREDLVVEKEIAAFDQLRYNGHNAVVVEDEHGNRYTVRFTPILVDQVFNLSHDAMEALPSWLGGAERQRQIAEQGLDQITQHALAYRANLHNLKLDSTTRRNKEIAIDKALAYADSEKFHSYLPEQKVLALLLLCEACDLPFLLHCMSSKDRSGMCIALASALEQYKALGLRIPDNYHDLLRDEIFRELFTANLMVGHNVSRFGRGSEGEVNSEKLEEHLGLELNANPPVCRLLADRYVKKVSLAKQAALTVGIYVGLFVLVPILLALLILPLGIGSIFSSKARKYLSILVFAFFHAYAFIPYAIVKNLLVLLIDGTLSLLHITNHEKSSTSWYYWRTALRELGRCLALYKLVPELELDKSSPYLEKRGLIKKAEKHPFVPRLQKVMQWLQNLPKERIQALTQLIKTNRPNLAVLTPTEKTMFLLLSDLKAALKNKFLKKKISKLPPHIQKFLQAVFSWKLYQFPTASSDATRKWIGSCLQDSGDWMLPVLRNVIPLCTAEFIEDDGQYNTANLDHRIARETTLIPVVIDGEQVTSHEQEDIEQGRQNCAAIRAVLGQKGIEENEINRILSCMQVSALVDGETAFRTSFFRQDDPSAAFRLRQEHNPPPHFVLTTNGPDGIILTMTTHYCFATSELVAEEEEEEHEELHPEQRMIFTTTLNYRTGKCSCSFATVRHPEALVEQA